jgi:hypothetical protein
MTRPFRFTVRLTANELSAIKQYANQIHAIPSAALRFLITKGLAGGNTDPKTVDTLTKQAEALIDKLGPEYFKLMDGLEQVDPKSSEAKEFMSILSELDKRCTK